MTNRKLALRLIAISACASFPISLAIAAYFALAENNKNAALISIVIGFALLLMLCHISVELEEPKNTD